jgi:uncharacterized protein
MIGQQPHQEVFFLNVFRDSGILVKLLLTLIIMFASLIILTSLSLLIAAPFFRLSLEHLSSLLSGNYMDSDISLLKFIQIVQSLTFFIIPAIILNYILFKPEKNFITTGKFPHILLIVLVIITLLVSSPIIELLVKWNSAMKFPSFMAGIEIKFQQLESSAAVLTEKLLSGTKITDYLFNLVMVAIIPAIGEEFLFRGVFQRILAEWSKNIHVAIILASILFSAFHLQFYGFIPRFLLGLFFGYLFYWKGNIWLAVFAHFINNFVAVTSDFLDKNSFKNLSDSLDTLQAKPIEIIVSIFLTIFLVSQIQRKFKPKPGV